MTAEEKVQHDQLLATAKERTMEAAEALDRGDGAEWQRLQDEAERLRNKAHEIAARSALKPNAKHDRKRDGKRSRKSI